MGGGGEGYAVLATAPACRSGAGRPPEREMLGVLIVGFSASECSDQVLNRRVFPTATPFAGLEAPRLGVITVDYARDVDDVRGVERLLLVCVGRTARRINRLLFA